MTTNSLAQDISKKSGWSIFAGVVTAVIGLVMIMYPFATATVTTVFLGWAFIFASAAQFVFAFTSDTAGNFFLKILMAILYAVGGIALAFFPIAGTAALTGVLGTILLIQGGLEAAAAFELRPLSGWGWILFDSFVSLGLGVMIIAEWPSSSLWAVGTLVGAGVLTNGITRIVVSAAIRQEVNVVAKGTV